MVKIKVAEALFLIFSVSLTLLATPLSAQEYKLSTGDQLRITLLENQQANDTYRVEIDGTVSVPGIGVINASGLGLREFEGQLRDKAAATIVDPSVSVQIVEYRPFFVLGDVDAAGIYPFTPGLNAMNAVAIAGGFGRQFDSDELSRSIAINNARKSLGETRIALFSSKVNLARFLAEAADEETFEFPASASGTLSQKDRTEIVESTVALFETKRNAFNTQMEKLQASLLARTREIDSFEAQIALQEEVLARAAEELFKLQDARERGLISVARINDAVRDEQNARAQSLQIITLKRQSEVTKTTVEREISDLVTNSAVEIDENIQAYQENIKRLTYRAQEDEALLLEIGASTSISSDDGPTYRLELHRDGVPISDDIPFDTKLEPGDTLFVILNRKAVASQ